MVKTRLLPCSSSSSSIGVGGVSGWRARLGFLTVKHFLFLFSGDKGEKRRMAAAS